MYSPNSQYAIIGLLAVAGLFTVMLMLKPKWKRASFIMVIFPITALIIFSGYGKFHHIYPVNPKKGYVRESKNVIFQWHEMWHYYTGSKYFKEMGYFGLYRCYALADQETLDPNIQGMRAVNIRTLENIYFYEPTLQALEKAQNEYRPHFTKERWRAFKGDYVYFRNTAGERWIDIGLWDAGFNPPPTWTVIGSSIANSLELSKGQWDVNDYKRGLLFPVFDIILLILMGLFLYRSFGMEPVCLFFLAYGTSYVSEPGWNMGSFLRYMWLFGLTGGICMIKIKRYFLAGLLLGFSVCCRVFPMMFLIGAGLSLLIYGVRQKDWNPLKMLVAGSASIGIALFGISLLMFGWGAYQGFFEKVYHHRTVNFVQSIGYKKIAVNDDVVNYPPTFAWETGINNFREWNYYLNDKWNTLKMANLPVIVICLAGVIVSMFGLKTYEALLLWGGMYLFFFEVLTCYYYIFLALVPAVLFTREVERKRKSILMAGFFISWMAIMAIALINKNDIKENYYISISIFGYFVFWTLAGLVPVIQTKYPGVMKFLVEAKTVTE